MTYIPRTLAVELKTVLGQYPVVTILGPRQSGKTTFARHECPDFGYVNLEDPTWREQALRDPKAFFSAHPRPLIIDEVQRVPELLSSIQVLADQEGKNGQFLLTGSHQLGLGHAISQSLSGRTALLTLLPLSIQELDAAAPKKDRDQLLFQGFLPRVQAEGQEPTRAYRNYFQTYVERDLRSILMVKNLLKFETFLRVMAGRIGQLFQASSIADEIGVSYKTIQEWISILEASFIIYRLPPYHKNLGKRLVKAYKVYFMEPGLATYLLGIEKVEHIARDPLFGSLFENMVVIEALKARVHRGKDPGLCFYRDSNANEVDLILDRRNDPLAIEIKSAMTFHPDFAKTLAKIAAITGSKSPGYVIYSGDMETSGESLKIVNFRHTARVIGGQTG